MYILFILSLLIPLAATAGTPQQAPIVVRTVVEAEVPVKSAQGKIEKKRIPVSKAPPGNEVIYTTTFTNQGDKPAGNIAIINPIPAHTTYLSGTVFGDNTEVTYSSDGGKTYAAPEQLRIKTPDGRERQALPSEYTHIRWIYKGDLAVAKVGTVGFRAVVN